MQVSFKPTVQNKQVNTQNPVLPKQQNPLHTNPQDSFVLSNKMANKVAFGLAVAQTPNPSEIQAGCAYNDKAKTLDFGIFSNNAERVELLIYKKPTGINDKDFKEAKRVVLEKHIENEIIEGRKEPVTKWVTSVPTKELKKQGIDILSEENSKNTVYYGYRIWGPNWKYDPEWTPGSDKGRISDVDDNGNRFNPNKLLTDPEATEVSHDPVKEGLWEDGAVYETGSQKHIFNGKEVEAYKIDNAAMAPKSIFVLDKEELKKPENKIHRPAKPIGAITSDNIIEEHVKGLTAGLKKEILENLYLKMASSQKSPEQKAKLLNGWQNVHDNWDDKYAGTYKGAGFMAPYLSALGMTMVEFLPVQEFQNSEKDTGRKNFWGYMTLSYKAPERNYAFDQTAGGPTKEFKEMVDTFHANGMKVCMDVVYNHTGEGDCHLDSKTGKRDANRAVLFNLRGTDNASYYTTGNDKKHYFDMNGCGADINSAHPIAQKLTVDSLNYFADKMGVDAFRFDLAPILGNTASREHKYWFDPHHPDSLLNKIQTKVHANLIAEPWSCGSNEIGNFTDKYAEWNGNFRDVVRTCINKFNGKDITPETLIKGFAGSQDEMPGKAPRSVNFVTCHDGFTMHDLFGYNQKQNYRHNAEGGTDDNISWNQNNNAEQRKEAIRTAQTLIAVSAGTPMILGGDERLDTKMGVNNWWNQDNYLGYINWGKKEHEEFLDKLRGKDGFPDPQKTSEEEKLKMTNFTSALFNFRKDHPALGPNRYYTPEDIKWLDAAGNNADDNYIHNPNNAVLAYKIDGTRFRGEGEKASGIYVAYNKGEGPWPINLPRHSEGTKWYMVADTSQHPNKLLGGDNIKHQGEEVPVDHEHNITLEPRSAVIFIEK
jgi:glycogen operon protein